MASVDSRRPGNDGGVGGAFQPYLDSLRQELQQRDQTLLSVVVAVLVVLLTLGTETAGGYGGCRRASPSLDWKDAGRIRHLGGRLERETHRLCHPTLYIKQQDPLQP